MTSGFSVNGRLLLGLIRRRGVWLLIPLVLFGAGAYFLSNSQERKYTAAASIMFNADPTNLAIVGLSSSAASTSNQDYAAIAALGDTAKLVAANLGLETGYVRQGLSFQSVSSTSIVNVSDTASSAKLSAEIANAYARVYVANQESSSSAYYRRALAVVTRQLSSLPKNARDTSSGLELQTRAQDLGLLAALQSNSVQLVQAAETPAGPSSPKIIRNVVLGSILGLLVGAAGIYVVSLFDRLVRDPKEFEQAYGIPLLGLVPESSALSRPPRAALAEGDQMLPALEPEAFDLIQAHLKYFNVDRKLQVIVLTSAVPGDGKSTLTANLGAAAARAGVRVLLIDADLRNPTLARRLAVKEDPGLADVLIDSVDMATARQALQVQSSFARSSDQGLKLEVLVAGSTTPPNPSALMDSDAMRGVLRQSREAYDLILVDTPPITAVPDAFSLFSEADGVIVVGRVNHDDRDAVQSARDSLAGANAPLLGLVVNGVRSMSRQYYSAYGYGARKSGTQS